MLFLALLDYGIGINCNIDFIEVLWIFIFIMFGLVLVVFVKATLAGRLVELFALLLKLFFQIFLLLTGKSLKTWLHFSQLRQFFVCLIFISCRFILAGESPCNLHV